MGDKRYPGFVALEWFAVDGFGLQRIVKEDKRLLVAAGPDSAWIELLVAISHKEWETESFLFEDGWFIAERQRDEWSFSSLGIRGSFVISHQSLLRIVTLIRELSAGQKPSLGEVLDADEWDRRYGWARESGLLESRVEALETLARAYLTRLEAEGVLPGQSISEELAQARWAVVDALEREGLTHREQPDAIFYQIRDRNATFLHRVLDALDMAFRFGADNDERHGVISLDWWILDPSFPTNGTFGIFDFTKLALETLKRAPVGRVEPLVVELFGQRFYLLLGRYQGRVEVRTAIAEDAFVAAWSKRLEQWCVEKNAQLAPPMGDVQSGLALPRVLRVFLEQIGNGGKLGSVTWLSLDEIVAENEGSSWQKPCPDEIRLASETVEWAHEALPDGLLCISGYYYNASRAYMLADGRDLWVTPTDGGYLIDPPGIWLWEMH